MTRSVAILWMAVSLAWAVPAWGWESPDKELRLQGKLQARSEANDETGEWRQTTFLRRAYVDLRWEPLKWARLELEGDLAEGDFQPKDVYGRLAPMKELRFQIGQFKKPFSRLQLTSPWDLLVAERGLTSELVIRQTQHGGFGGREPGMMLSGRFKSALGLEYALGVFNGDGKQQGVPESHRDWVVRVQLEPLEKLEFAANASHKQVFVAGQTFTYNGFGADLAWRWEGFSLDLEAFHGDNVNAGEGHRLTGVYGILGYRLGLGSLGFLTPATMIEWLDPDDQTAGGAALRVAGALNWDVEERVRVVLHAEGILGEPTAFNPSLGQALPLARPTRVLLQLNLAF